VVAIAAKGGSHDDMKVDSLKAQLRALESYLTEVQMHRNYMLQTLAKHKSSVSALTDSVSALTEELAEAAALKEQHAAAQAENASLKNEVAELKDQLAAMVMSKATSKNIQLASAATNAAMKKQLAEAALAHMALKDQVAKLEEAAARVKAEAEVDAVKAPLKDLLSENKLAMYTDTLFDAGVLSMDDFAKVTEDSMVAMGIEKKVHRRKILGLVGEAAAAAASKAEEEARVRAEQEAVAAEAARVKAEEEAAAAVGAQC
jgi:regulator of replication initiation timing